MRIVGTSPNEWILSVMEIGRNISHRVPNIFISFKQHLQITFSINYDKNKFETN
jgi:hypothetical protein